MIYPLPAVLISCGDNPDNYNMFTVSWVGTTCTNPAMCYISVRPERHSYPIIKESGEFVINLTPASLVEVCDYVGTVTGRCVDKIKKTGLSLIESKEVAAPTLADSPLSLECKVISVQSHGSHDMFIADVVQVSVDESLMDESGHLCLDRARLLTFAHGEYFEIGRKLGKIGISVQDKKKGKLARVKKK